MEVRSVSVGAVAGLLVGGLLVRYFTRPTTQAITESTQQPAQTPQHIIDEVYSRIQAFFGDEAFAKVRDAFVVVVGVGGVGSHAANMIARSGVGYIRVVDFDQVTLSSLNRHAFATLQDVGLPKAQVVADYITRIVPWCKVDVRSVMFTQDAAASLLESFEGRQPQYVVDCIDDVDTKSALLGYCQAHNIPVIAAMSAGGKADPTRLQMGTLTDAARDPLASKMRWRLRKDDVPFTGITTVFSSELPRVKLLPLTDEQAAAPEDFGAVDNFRTRVIPVLGTSPAIMGQACASYILCELAGKPYTPQPVAPMSAKARQKFVQNLQNREKKFGNTAPLVDKDDIEFLVTEMWRAKCAVTLEKLERKPMTITRWRKQNGPFLHNYVLLQVNLADQLDGSTPEEVFDAEVVARVDSVLETFKGVGERCKLSKDGEGERRGFW